MTTEELKARKEELVQAFATVLGVIDIATDMGEPIPSGAYSYLWNKWFRLDSLEIE